MTCTQGRAWAGSRCSASSNNATMTWAVVRVRLAVKSGLGRLGERVEQGFEDFGGERCDLGGGVAMTLSEACEVTDLLAAVPDGGYGS